MKVPVLRGPRTETRALDTRTPSVDRSLGLDALGQGLQGAAKGFDHVAAVQAKAKQEARAYRADDLDLRAGRIVNEEMHSKERGFLNQLGENALDNGPVMDRIRARLKELEDGESDEEVKRSFRLRRQAREDQALTASERHSHRERLTVYGKVAEGQAALALETAGQATTREEIDSAVSKALVDPEGKPGPFRRWLTEQGFPLEKVEAEEKALRAKAYGTALTSRLGVEDGAGARALFEQVRGELPADVAADFERRIVATEDRALAERVTAEAVAAAKHPISGRVDEKAARKALDAVPETKRKQVAERLEAQINVEDDNWKATVRGHYDGALTAYLKGGRLLNAIPGTTRDWLEEHAPEAWEKLWDNHQQSLARQRAGRGEGGATPAQRSAYLKMQLEMANKRDEYTRMSEEEFRERWWNLLSESDFRAGGSALAGIQKHDRDAEAKGYLADDTEIRTTAVARAAEAGVAKKEDLAEFKRDIEGWLAEWRSANGEKKPPRAEVDAAIARHLIKKKVKRPWYQRDEEKFSFQVKPGEKTYTEDAEAPPPSATTAPVQPAGGKKRVRDPKTGRTGTWDGKSPLPPGVEVIDG